MADLAVIAASIAQQRCTGEADFEQRVLKAMRGAREFDYMLLDEGRLLLAALVGAMMESDGDERRQIDRTLKFNKMLDAMAGGIPVDVEIAIEEFDDLPPWPCRPIRDLWVESGGENR